MNLISLDIPERPAELASWLERTLLGSELAALVAELSAVRPPSPGAMRHEDGRTTLSGLFGDRMEAVLAQGLNAAFPEDLRTLLREPHLLLDFQEVVFTEGGSYWDQLPQAEAGTSRYVDRGWKHLQRIVIRQKFTAREERPMLTFAPRPRMYQRTWFVGLAAAASVLMAVVLFREAFPTPTPSAPAGWGWSKAGALAQDLSAPEYLLSLAASAKAWFNKRPESSPEVAQRILEFRHGCSILLLTEHRPLVMEDRQWLAERCRAWAEKLDGHLEELETGENPVKVRAKADDTVNKLIAALQKRAEEAEKLASVAFLPVNVNFGPANPPALT